MESVGDASSNYEDEAFESMSMSKSMVGIGLGLGAKAGARKSVVSSSNAQDDYSNEDFESVTMSKSITVSASNKVVKPSKEPVPAAPLQISTSVLAAIFADNCPIK